jgi:4-amino-4-deoxy-L-arabinose transferase-like glycosyltransferase
VKHRQVILLAIILIVAVYLSGVGNQWFIKSDSALYLGLGRSLDEGRGMEFNEHQWYGIPPGLPLMIAASHRVFGDAYWPLNLLGKLLALGIVGLSYLCFRRLAADLPDALRTGVAVGATIIVALSARLYIDSSRILTDVPCLFFIMLGLYGFLRGRREHWFWYALGTAAFIAATLTRLVGIIFLVGAVAAILADLVQRRSLRSLVWPLAAAAIVGLALAVWAIGIRTHEDAGTLDYFDTLAKKRFDPFAAATYAALGDAFLHVPGAAASALVDQKLPYTSLAPLGLILMGLWTALRRRQLIVVLPVVFYAGFLILLRPTAVAPRYFLPMMPLLAYSLLLGVRTLTSWAARRRAGDSPPRVRLGWALPLAVLLCVAVSLPKIGREIYWTHHPRFYEVIDNGDWRDIVDVSRYLAARGDPKTDHVLVQLGPIVHYLTRLPTGLPNDPIGRKLHHIEDQAPAAFVRMAERGDFAYVVVPLDLDGWSAPVQEALQATGRFSHPPETFGALAVYARSPQPPAP